MDYTFTMYINDGYHKVLLTQTSHGMTTYIVFCLKIYCMFWVFIHLFRRLFKFKATTLWPVAQHTVVAFHVAQQLYEYMLLMVHFI